MPQAFNECRANGGEIRTVSGPDKQMGLNASEYVHICIKNGKSYMGYKKVKKVKNANLRPKGK